MPEVKRSASVPSRPRARGRAARQDEVLAPVTPPAGLDLSAEYVERTAPPRPWPN